MMIMYLGENIDSSFFGQMEGLGIEPRAIHLQFQGLFSRYRIELHISDLQSLSLPTSRKVYYSCQGSGCLKNLMFGRNISLVRRPTYSHMGKGKKSQSVLSKLQERQGYKARAEYYLHRWGVSDLLSEAPNSSYVGEGIAPETGRKVRYTVKWEKQ
jgi:hypothetical protein